MMSMVAEEEMAAAEGGRLILFWRSLLLVACCHICVRAQQVVRLSGEGTLRSESIRKSSRRQGTRSQPSGIADGACEANLLKSDCLGSILSAIAVNHKFSLHDLCTR